MTTTILDTEFVLWSPTYISQGGNPTTNIPAGGSIAYTADTPGVTKLQFKSPDGGESPDLNVNGTEGTYVRSGTVGSGLCTATPAGFPPTFVAESETFEVTATEAGTLNMTVGAPKKESAPGNDPLMAAARR